jgi:thioredoxin-like negative regulator of GroEL
MKLLYFSASWCGPCKSFGPIMDQVAQSGIPVQKVNIDVENELTAKYGIRSVPTVIKVDGNGNKLDMFVGVRDANTVKQFYNG